MKFYVPVNNGVVVYSVVLSAGDYEVEATYMGDSKFNCFVNYLRGYGFCCGKKGNLAVFSAAALYRGVKSCFNIPVIFFKKIN